jgi:hypothetical protein
VLALIQAPGLVGANLPLQPEVRQLLFEEFLQGGLSCGIATSARVFRWALISADKDVPFEAWHNDNVQDLQPTV